MDHLIYNLELRVNICNKWMVIFYCTDCPDVDERLLQSDAEPGVTELETSIQLDQNVETPGQVDRSSLQAEMRSFSICSVLADQSPAANSTFRDSERYSD